MSWQRAPVYIHLHDLCVWFGERAVSAIDPAHRERLASLTRLSDRLLDHAAIALSLPEVRAESLLRADQAAIQLRVRVRVARDCGALSASQARFVLAAVDTVGRMLGGWRRQLRRARPKPAEVTS